MIEKNCRVCIRSCRIGQSFCQRRDENGNIKQKKRLCAIQVDHLFDKPLVHFSRNMKVLSIGSWGCNLRCQGCQNARLSWTTTGADLGHRDLESHEIVKLALKNQCEGICYTYNEPAILMEAVEEVAEKAKDAGLLNFFITNSTLSEYSVQRIAPLMDAVAADIKSLEDDFYYCYCGAAGIPNVAKKILECIRGFHESCCHVEVRTNIIPGANDQDQNFFEIAAWIKECLGKESPWHITRFFPAHNLSHLPPTPTRTLLKAQRIGLREGLVHVHTHFKKGCDCASENSLIVEDSMDATLDFQDCCHKKGLPHPPG